MKSFKIISIGCILLSFIISLKGQTEQGNLLLGGDTKLAFTSLNSKWKTDDNKGDFGKTTNLVFSPIIGTFVTNGLALGVEIPINYLSNKYEDDDKYSMTSFAFAPFLRSYFGTSNVKPYLHVEIGFGNMIMKNDPSTSASSSSSTAMYIYQIGGGLGIFLKENVSLDIGFGYASTSIKALEDNDINYRNISSGLGFEIGIVVVL